MTKCTECNADATTEQSAVVRYTMGGLPHVELHGVEVTRCAECGAEDVAIPGMAQLHRVIAEGFVTQSRKIAPIELRFLRKHIGLSTADFAQMMGVSRETVSRWETGAKPLSAVADRLLRLLVVTHQPSECYAVDDLLRELSDEPVPSRLASISVWRTQEGWKENDRPELAVV